MSAAAEIDRLLASGARQDAIRLAEMAAARGDAGATYRIALWLLIGDPLPRDLVKARAWLRRAVSIGHTAGALMEVALTANGSGGTPDWSAALALLRHAARGDAAAVAQLDLVEAMTLDDEGYPLALPEPEQLSNAPDLRLYRSLVSPAECAHLAEAARDLLAPSLVTDPRTGRLIAHPVRTSHGAVIGPTRESLVVQAVARRLAAVSGTRVAQGEPFSILHYAPGQEYRPHHDALPAEVARGNQRTHTLLVYLNEGYGGGGTRFISGGLEVRARAGDVLLFPNLLATGAPDPATRHAGLPVTRGAKWMATRWVRAKPYDPWRGC